MNQGAESRPVEISCKEPLSRLKNRSAERKVAGNSGVKVA